MIEKVKEVFIFILYFVASCLIAAILALAIYGFAQFINRNNKKEQTTSPVEEVVRVDSIIKENNNTKIIIEHLNTEKNEQVIKVRNLSNDSTLELFYKLVKE